MPVGYNARCTLTILDDLHKDRVISTVEVIRRMSDEARFAIDDQGRPSGNEGSWRTSDEDLLKVTKLIPGLLLQLDKVGDYDEPFFERTYYRGGAMQKCKGVVVYDPLDPSKLPSVPAEQKPPLEVTSRWTKCGCGCADYELEWTISRGDRKLVVLDGRLRAWVNNHPGDDGRFRVGPTDVLRMFHMEHYYDSNQQEKPS